MNNEIQQYLDNGGAYDDLPLDTKNKIEAELPEDLKKRLEKTINILDKNYHFSETAKSLFWKMFEGSFIEGKIEGFKKTQEILKETV